MSSEWEQEEEREPTIMGRNDREDATRNADGELPGTFTVPTVPTTTRPKDEEDD